MNLLKARCTFLCVSLKVILSWSKYSLLTVNKLWSWLCDKIITTWQMYKMTFSLVLLKCHGLKHWSKWWWSSLIILSNIDKNKLLDVLEIIAYAQYQYLPFNIIKSAHGRKKLITFSSFLTTYSGKDNVLMMWKEKSWKWLWDCFSHIGRGLSHVSTLVTGTTKDFRNALQPIIIILHFVHNGSGQTHLEQLGCHRCKGCVWCKLFVLEKLLMAHKMNA